MLHTARYCILDHFLLPEEMESMWRYVIARQRDFHVTQVRQPQASASAIDRSYRRSRVLTDLGAHRDFIARRLRSYLPAVLRRLARPSFKLSHLDLQLTATNDGEFFRSHSDSGVVPYQTRRITFVLYFNRQPKSFTGGELVLYDTLTDGTESCVGGEQVVIEPRHNRIVFFASDLLHEVRTVSCASQAFRDSRFTLNGWFHSARGQS